MSSVGLAMGDGEPQLTSGNAVCRRGLCWPVLGRCSVAGAMRSVCYEAAEEALTTSSSKSQVEWMAEQRVW